MFYENAGSVNRINVRNANHCGFLEPRKAIHIGGNLAFIWSFLLSNLQAVFAVAVSAKYLLSKDYSTSLEIHLMSTQALVRKRSHQ